jgi:hypothetical protein
MRIASLASLLALTAACSSPATREDARSTSSAQTAQTGQGDQADTSCQVVLRHTYIDFEGRFGPQTDCSSGTCWVVITVTFDVAMSQSLAQSEAFVFYQGEASTTWTQSAQAQPIFGAPVGFRRYQVVLDTDTFTEGNGDTNIQLVPFIDTFGGSSGARLFDHNRVADPMGAYQLDALNNWTINDDASACPGTTPANTLAVTFPTGWNDTSTGALASNGKLDVSYDVYRMPSTLSCTTDGVYAVSTWGYVQFQPGGEVLGESAIGPFDSTTGKLDSLPLEFDVPAGAQLAAMWFETSSDCNGNPQWDSNYGQNYTYRAP